ncbi:translation machinery-associated protein 22-like [Primulina tabacum]|uniref:translation machinery-associated protein 22-like n=1 Tax=Primulina tabacum TaxID=48773 RepID=UPI003F5A3652
MAEKPEPVRVLYCGVCGFPAEYCEFGSDFDKCKPWLIQNAPDLYPDLVIEAGAEHANKVADQLQSTSISSNGSSSQPKEEVKRLPGGKIKKRRSRK